MPSVESRIAVLTDALERRRMEQEAPIDGLSESLYELGRELAGLDDMGKAILLEELNRDGLGLDAADLEQMIREAEA